MRILLQKVKRASVTVGETLISEISDGLLLLVGLEHADSSIQLKPLAEKIINLRLFANGDKNWDRSVLELDLEILVVSQFTLYAECNKGRRPDFSKAMPPAEARIIFDAFVNCFKELGVKKVRTGEFGAFMQVELINDGPVTILLESHKP